MIYNLLITAILIVAFFSCICSFIWGCKVGKSLSKDNIPTVKLNPIKAYTEHKEAKVEKVAEDLLAQGAKNIMDYDGYPQD